jgi:hypothetical protein
MIRLRLLSIFAACLAAAGTARAELKSLEFLKREMFAGGKSFGTVGPYEKFVGIARYELDPDHERNAGIVDLKLAPRNAAGKVEFEADFFILAPHDPRKNNGAILYDVNNRGGKLALRFFNHAKPTNDPKTLADAGDGFLMRQGYVIVWSGWLGELLPGEGRLLMRPPVALENGKPLKGVVRYEIMTDAPAETMPLSRRENHGSFPLTEQGLKDGTLTVRLKPGDSRVVIARDQWSLETLPIPQPPEVAANERSVAGSLPQICMKLTGGFKPGYLYELVAECEGSLVQGVCYPAVRDLVSFLRYDESRNNPTRTVTGRQTITRAHGFGVSQSGRYLRNFLYLGFNADEQGRKVFDGLMPHVAGAGLGYFNHRFCQPTRLNSQHLEHTYPSDYFPFAYGDDIDPHTDKQDGLQRRSFAATPDMLPKVMNTQGTGEYWHRAGSLVHTDPLGMRDAEIPSNVRLYTFGGTQHSATSLPLTRGMGEQLLNPADYNPQLRALLTALDRWTRDGTEPPPSVYPTIASGTLVDFVQTKTCFPAIPGVRYPQVIHQPERLDFGPEFESRGITTIEPPHVGAKYGVKVPRVGPDGNELGTLAPVEVVVPTATYTGWNLRRAEVGAEGELVSLMGSYIPLAKTKAERTASGDPRESLAERYGTFDRYRAKFIAAADDYVRRRYLLEEDAKRLIAGLDELQSLFPPRPAVERNAAGELEPVASPRFVAMKEMDAIDANQAAAVAGDKVFGIGNRGVTIYERASGLLIARSKPIPGITHLNSGFFEAEMLRCAHSNYPAEPASSEVVDCVPFYNYGLVARTDPKALDESELHLVSLKIAKKFGKYRGSLTWVVRHDNSWWCTFANYGDKNGETMLVEFDKKWDELGAWKYPPEVVRDLGKASISGGLWYRGDLLATGHDRKVIYKLKVPKTGDVLELIEVLASPFTGQGIAYDDKTGGLVGIDRARRKIVFAELRE